MNTAKGGFYHWKGKEMTLNSEQRRIAPVKKTQRRRRHQVTSTHQLETGGRNEKKLRVRGKHRKERQEFTEARLVVNAKPINKTNGHVAIDRVISLVRGKLKAQWA